MPAQNSLPWRLARLNPAWISLLILTSVLFPLSEFSWNLEPNSLDRAVAKLVLFELQFACLALPLLYVYGVIHLVSGRFHSPLERRMTAPTVAIVLVMSMALGFLPWIAVVGGLEKNDVTAVLLVTLPWFIGAAVSAWQLLRIASKELVWAEWGVNANRLRQFGTFLALLFWPVGFFWVQARIRRLVREFETGEFTRLPMDGAYFPDEETHDEIGLTEHIGPELAEVYAQELVRRTGGSILRRRKTTEGLSWAVKIEGIPLMLFFERDPQRMYLKSQGKAGQVLLDQLWVRFREGI